MKIKITLPNGSKKQYNKGVTPLDIAKDISFNNALAAKVDSVLVDLTGKIEKDAKVEFVTFKDKEGIEVFRHSSAHLLAHAVTDLFPRVKTTIGPVVEEGFYYDFDKKEPFTPEDVKKIEKRMKELVHEKIPIERSELTKAEAKRLFKDNEYKLELIEEFGKDLSVYKQGKFIDLCIGPHVPNTSYLKAFKITKIAGAYWRGNAKNPQLQRVYGVSFPDKEELKKYLFVLEEANKRNHRKLGKELGLFSIHDEAPGMPFFHNKGTFIFNKLVEFMTEEMNKLGYEFNKTPLILNKELWLRSGHWDHYKENMYFTKIDEEDFAVKPMNCPGNILIFKTKLHSYKELPIKAGEYGIVHRHELSGVLSGLFRVRVFTQDDAHVFCTKEQLKEEIIELIELVHKIYSTFGFEYNVELSTKPEKAMGDAKIWALSEKVLSDALEAKKIKFKLNPGEGAFYGPKIDFHIKDALGRSWQCGTIQVDFSMPEKFDLTYDGADGKKHRPVMIHRAIYGSLERFMGILIEHYAGKFPLWLSPVQVRIISIADRHNKYVEDVRKRLFDAGMRVETDTRAETVNKKIREAQLQKIPYILVCGDKEIKDKTVNVRTRDNEVKGAKKVDDFLKELLKEIESKK